MTIGVDGNDANVSKKVGVSVYTHSLLTYFQKQASEQTRFLVYLREKPNSDMPEKNQYFKYQVVSGPALWSQVFLPLRLFTAKKPNVFFSPAHYTPRLAPCPVVVTIHDLAYFYYPDEFLKKDLYKLINWTKTSVEKAKRIIAVSENTKKDLVKFYQVPENKIAVIYNGFEKIVTRETPWDAIAKRYQLKKEKYILYVGTLQPRKNIPVLIDAFAKFQKNNTDMKLVLVGKKGWLYESIFKKAQESRLTDNIIFTDFIPDEDIVPLYKNAFCFVLPSLYEGFGVPILEALSFNCPVICSFTSSLPEVGGDACIYFDPQKVDGLVEDLESLLGNIKLRKELIAKGKKQVEKFSWQTCAEKTLKLLKEL